MNARTLLRACGVCGGIGVAVEEGEDIEVVLVVTASTNEVMMSDMELRRGRETMI